MAAAITAVSVLFAGCVDAAGLADAKCVTVCNGVCVDVQRDSANCGTCGNVCGEGQVCAAGACKVSTCIPGTPGCECAGGTTSCGGACVDTKVDPSNCGACGARCGTGQVCSAGACACPASAPDACGTGASAACTNVASDASNCGACGNACPTTQTCNAGKCMSSATPPSLSLLAGRMGSAGTLNGVGTAARFNQPWSVCVDGGDAYVMDGGNCVIRKVVLATGATSTFAGAVGNCARIDGIGIAARLSTVAACTTDGAGNLYFTERGSCAVRKAALATGAITTVAGGLTCGYLDGVGTGARMSSPQGIAYDGTANLYVGDTNNHAIRKIELTNANNVVTFAGGPPPTPALGTLDDVGTAARFNGPQMLHVDATNGFVYVADYTNHTIRRIATSNAQVTTVVGTAGLPGTLNATGTAARLRNPIGMAFDGTNKLYVTEDGNHDVRVVSLVDFAVTTHVGTAVAGYADGTGSGALFFNPRGIAFDGSGNYYIADLSNHAIRKVNAAGGVVTTLAGLGAAFGSSNGAGATATFNYPWGLAYDGNATLYLSDYNNHTVRSVNLTTGDVATVAGSPGLSGNVDGTGAGARFTNPAGIVLDGKGNLFVADRSNHTIRKVVVATGDVTTIAGTALTPGYLEGTGTGATFNNPIALAYDGGNPGKLYVADYNNHLVRELDLATAATSLVAGAQGVSAFVDAVGTDARFAGITGLGYRAGKLYVADANRIRLLDVGTKSVVTFAGTGPGYADGTETFATFNFSGASAQLSFDSAGDLLFADFNNNVFRKLTTSTATASTLLGVRGSFGAVPGPMPTTLPTQPRAIVAVPGGYAFVANYGVYVVR